MISAPRLEATDISAASYVSDIFAKYTVGIPALQLRAQTVAAQALMSTFTDLDAQLCRGGAVAISGGQTEITLDASLGRLPALCDQALTAWRALPPVSPYAQVAMQNAEISLHQPVTWPRPSAKPTPADTLDCRNRST